MRGAFLLLRTPHALTTCVDPWHGCCCAFFRNALYLYNAMLRLKGMWVKFGQYLSSRNDLLPDE
jgi:hypothetical protein